MNKFHVNQIVKGKRAGTFVILGFREMHGEAGAQLKPINPEDFSDTGAGELWLPLTAIEPLVERPVKLTTKLSVVESCERLVVLSKLVMTSTNEEEKRILTTMQEELATAMRKAGIKDND